MNNSRAARIALILLFCSAALCSQGAVQAATTEVHIVKLAYDEETVLSETTVDYLWMEDNLPVYGDGVMHYYHQGPVFKDDPNDDVEQQLRWNPEEDDNCYPIKDMGALKGTNVLDLCELVGGMSEGERLKIRSQDGWNMWFAYENVYEYPDRTGPMVLCWYNAEDGTETWERQGEGYVPEYYSGMRLVWFADTSTNPWGGHVFGNWDWHEAADEEYWYYYYGSPSEMYPTTTGLSGKYISEISIYSDDEPIGSVTVTSSPAGAEIFLDGDGTGSYTNSTVDEIPAGEHTVGVVIEGYAEPEPVEVEVQHGVATPVHFDLEALTGSLAISSEPDGATIFLDDTELDQVTDTVIEDVAVGSHVVELQKEGYITASDRVVIAEGETTEVHFELEASDGSLDASGLGGKKLFHYADGVVRGNINLTTAGVYTVIEGGDSSSLILPLIIGTNESVSEARLYVYYNHSVDTLYNTAVEPGISVALDGKTLRTDATYTEKLTYEDEEYELGTLCYDVTDRIGAPGDYTLLVANTGNEKQEFDLHGAGLLLILEDPASPLVAFEILEGCDAIRTDTDEDEDTATEMEFGSELEVASINTARLLIVSTSETDDEESEHGVTVNDGSFPGVLESAGSTIRLADLDVGAFLYNSENEGEIASLSTETAGDYLENRNAVLIAEYSNQTGVAEPEESVTGTGEGDILPESSFKPQYALPAAGKISNASLLVYGDEGFRILFAANTTITDPTGEAVNALFFELPESSYGPAHSIGPSGALVNPPAVIAVSCGDSCEDGAMIGRLNGSGWDQLKTRFDSDAGVLSCLTGVLGTYSVLPAVQQEEEDENEEAENPIIALIEAILAIFFGPAEEKPAAPEPVTFLPETLPEEPIVIQAAIEPPDPEKSTFSLTMYSNPQGALIAIDGEYTGKVTPYTVPSLKGGNHTLKFALDGFVDEAEQVYLDRNLTCSFELSAANASALNQLKFDPFYDGVYSDIIGGVYVDSRPDGATIYMDGTRTEYTTPHLIYGVKEGKHTIKVKKEEVDFAVYSKSVWVYNSSVTDIFFNEGAEFTRSVSIESDAMEGCAFSVNGRFPEEEIPDTVEVAGINAYVTVLVNGTYRSYAIDTWIDGETEWLPDEEPEYTRILIESAPGGAEIFIDGFRTGLCTPYLLENVSVGQHTVVVHKDGYLPESAGIYLVPNGKAERLDFALESYPYGTLHVDSTPSGAKIYLFNRYTGEKTPAVFPYMNIGVHTVKLVGDGVSTERDDVCVRPFEVTYVNESLE